jgi:hypothetical protein
VHAANVALAVYHLRHDDAHEHLARAEEALRVAGQYVAGQQALEKLRFKFVRALVDVAKEADVKSAASESARRFADLDAEWKDKIGERAEPQLILTRARFNARLSQRHLNKQAVDGLTDLPEYTELANVPYWKTMADRAISNAPSANTAKDWARLLLHPLSPVSRR